MDAADSSQTPWGESECLQYAVYEKVGGEQVGAAVFSIHATEREGQNLWKIRLETLLDQPAITVVDVDRESFLPVYSYYSSDALGEIEANYRGDGVSVERRLHPNSKQLKQKGSTYDLYQSCYLMRLFPLEEGYQRRIFITNSKLPVEQSPATFRIVNIETLKTRSGERIPCYRVDVKIDEIRSSFWISTDEKRWLYRIVDDSGVSFELIPPDHQSHGFFQSDQYGYCFQMPEDWLAFVEQKKRGPDQEQVAVMVPGLRTELTLTRYRKFGDFGAVADGSLQWLKKNKLQFTLLPDSVEDFHGPEVDGRWFCGKFQENDRWRYLFNAVAVSGDQLMIVTGIAAEEEFRQQLPELQRLVRSIRQVENFK